MSTTLVVDWTFDDFWYLDCSQHTGVTCIHRYDYMTGGGESEHKLPTGRVRLPLSGEFPTPNAITQQVAMTREMLGSFDIQVSDKMNAYGTRKIHIHTYNNTVFLMTFNPEDPLVSIYSSFVEFIRSQVGYPQGERLTSCRAQSHGPTEQDQLEFLDPLVSVYPILREWDLISRLTSQSCIACMWKRSMPAVLPTADASGLGNL
jgi:hypothetical protein